MKLRGIGTQKILQRYDVKKTKDGPGRGSENIFRAQSDVNSGSSGDNIKLSSRAGLLNRARDIINTSPDIRNEKIAGLKREIENGTYRIDSNKIADKMLREAISELI